MKTQDRVLLEAFNGTTVVPDKTEKHENYWVLIGLLGTIIDDNASDKFVAHDGFKRMLVQFDTILDDLGLENHNQTKNSLWIRISDLKRLS